MGANLTQAAEKVLGEIYAAYLDRRSEGFSKNSAMDFSDQTNWPDPDWRTEDGEEALNELSHAKLIQKDILGGFTLTNSAIIYMENRFKDGVSGFLEWLGKIRQAIPFV